MLTCFNSSKESVNKAVNFFIKNYLLCRILYYKGDNHILFAAGCGPCTAKLLFSVSSSCRQLPVRLALNAHRPTLLSVFYFGVPPKLLSQLSLRVTIALFLTPVKNTAAFYKNNTESAGSVRRSRLLDQTDRFAQIRRPGAAPAQPLRLSPSVQTHRRASVPDHIPFPEARSGKGKCCPETDNTRIQS